MFAFILSRGSRSTDCSFREKVHAELLCQERVAWIPLLVPAQGPEERSATPPSPPSRGPSALYPVPGWPPPAVSTHARGTHWADPAEGREPPRSEASAALGPTPAGMQPLTSCHLCGDTQGPSVHALGLSRGVCPK